MKGKKWSGTGFFYQVSTNRGSATFIVSNRHVLENIEELEVRLFPQKDGKDQPDLQKAFTQKIAGISKADKAWQLHPDPEVDIAVLGIAPMLNQLATQGKKLFYRAIVEDFVLRKEKASDLDAIEDVLIIGYPKGLIDSKNFTPIVRRGITATPIELDYEGKPVFLVDAAVFEGSSGSPVFTMSASHIDPTGRLVVGQRLMLLGVLAAGFESKLKLKTESKSREKLNLGIVFKSWAVDECVDALLAKHGMTRKPASPKKPSAQPSPADSAIAEDSKTS